MCAWGRKVKSLEMNGQVWAQALVSRGVGGGGWGWGERVTAAACALLPLHLPAQAGRSNLLLAPQQQQQHAAAAAAAALACRLQPLALCVMLMHSAGGVGLKTSHETEFQ